ncbi:mechanosensitive ion channel family protein [Rufibacter roseus]|uniref:Mechanosensitive ion channel family protein n=1 Tax=Rufibacter roseus TaxID=1567108 RepID=A0ABW2DPU7_9BACT|nr:mechanosensitive ion channel domain-containing protein [Rufibacter roseus]
MLDTDFIFTRIQDFALLYGIRILIALFILIIGLWLINRITTLVYNVMTRRNMDPSLRPFLRNVLKVLLMVLLIIVVIGQVGLEVTSFIALLGSAGLAIGLALQGSLSNFAGGVLLLTVKPFKVGDFIETQGQKGTVSVINIFNTVIRTGDNKHIYFPNGPLASAVIINYDAQQTRRVDMAFTVDYGNNLAQVKNILLETALADPRVMKEPAPTAGISMLNEQSVTLYLRAWCERPNYWPLFESLVEKAKDRLVAEKVTLPYTRQEIRTTSGSSPYTSTPQQ